MSDYTDFWVVVGTAAPVVGLAYAVAIGDAAHRFARNPKDSRLSQPPALAMSGFAMCGTVLLFTLLRLGGAIPENAIVRWTVGGILVAASYLIVFDGLVSARREFRGEGKR
ncbi:MAG: hypothetical protein ACR2IK_20450 [Chloroflexota bacterium]